MALFFHTYKTLEQAKSTREKARKNQIKPPKDIGKLNTVKDDDKLFSYALVDDLNIALQSASLLSDPLAIHRLIELPANKQVLKTLALNPHRSREDLWLIMQHLNVDERKDQIAHLSDEDDLIEMALKVPGTGAQKFALSRLTSFDAIEQVILHAHERVAAEAILRLKAQAQDAQERLYRQFINALDQRIYDRAAIIRKSIEIHQEEADEKIVTILLQEMSGIERISPFLSLLLSSMTTPSCFYHFAATADIERHSLNYAGHSTYDLSDQYKKYCQFEHEKEELINQAVKRLDDDLRYQLAQDEQAFFVARRMACEEIRNEEYLMDLILHNKYASRKKAISHINSPRRLKTIAMALSPGDYEYSAIIRKLAKTRNGQKEISEMLMADLEKNKLNSVCLQALTDDDLLYEVIKRYPESQFIQEIGERLLSITKNQDYMLEIFKTYDCISQTAIDRINEAEPLREIALYAKSSYAKSLAAKRLCDLHLDRGHVKVMHHVCRYCGGHITTKTVYAGTIEEHNFYQCDACGRHAHQTIHGDGAAKLIGDYYYYKHQ